MYMQVIKETSALTFMIAGTCKEVVTVITAVIVFGDKFGFVNGIGLVIVIGGVLLFNWYKLSKLRQQVRQRIHSKEGSLDVDLELDDDDAAGAASSSGGGSGGSPRRLAAAGAAAGGGGGGGGIVVVGSSSSISRGKSPELHVMSSGSWTTKRKSGTTPTPPSAADDEPQSAEDVLSLEFEPLLPLNGVMVRR